EADQIGLILMSRAGYDPTEAPKFWKRFGQQNSEKPMEFFSTHPSDERRSADLQAMLPEAYKEYESAPQQYALGMAILPPGTLNTEALAKQTPAAPTPTAPQPAASNIQPAANFQSNPSKYLDPFAK
ncbi:MAG: M48 family metalloprotease, partial [Planctomycetaceae bacterium]|nr:M48 family metalloprotease [Planctomycetaceae bacterium]